MNRHNDLFDPRIASWLEDDPTTAPGQVLETVVAAIPSIPQRRAALRVPWRLSPMTTSARVLAVIAAAVVIALGGLFLVNRTPSVGGPAASPSSPPGSLAPSSAPSSSPASTPGPIDGTWTTVFTGSDPAEISKAPGGQQIPIGTWYMTIQASGTAELATLIKPDGEHILILAHYLTPDEIVFSPNDGCGGTVGVAADATYRYALSGRTLTLTQVGTDYCADRAANLTAHPWTKQGG